MSNQYNVKTKTTKTKSRRLPLLIVVLILAVVAGAGYALVRHHNDSKPAKVTIPRTANAQTKGEEANNGAGSNAVTANGSAQSTVGPSQNSQAKATASSGSPTLAISSATTFVSDHSPNLSGSPHPNTLNSACVTNPGASCSIIFTSSSGVVKSLPAETTDSGGAAYWNGWKLQTYGLTAGSWTIEAKATLNGQTVTAKDSRSLDITQ